MSDQGYIDYFAVLGLAEDAKQGEVRNQYKRLMRDLVMEIQRVEITAALRDRFLLDLAKLNAAFYILRNSTLREQYVTDRHSVMALETEWRKAVEIGGDLDHLRRSFDAALRHFLSRYMEELMLEAGRDQECVEASHWDASHERHAGRILRHFRQELYHQIHERLPYYDVTAPEIDWDERERTVGEILHAGAR
jgi:curved DNA-binding protein CbpA